MKPSLRQGALSQQQVFRTWWPLAASWMLMGLELPAVSAVIARLAHPEISLAAYGIVFALALLIESPIIMLLAASTALSRDWDSYLKVRRFMMNIGAALTVLHIVIAFTPLYDIVVVPLVGIPNEIIEPVRWGMMLMTPWTWAIAYRRFNQGVLIRFGHSNAVGLGTVVRLSANLFVLALGWLIGELPGIVVATSAVSTGVMSEALFVGLRVRPVLKTQLKRTPTLSEPLTWSAFAHFYLPLVMTSFLTLLALPLGSAAMSRMPQALASLAVWPALSGLLFLLRSVGIAYNEVVVALLEEPKAVASLRRFAYRVAAVTTLLPLLISVTPLGQFWFAQFSGLAPELAALAQWALGLGFLLPGLTVLQSYFQGILMHDRRTRGITEAVIFSLLTGVALLGMGIAWGQLAGVYVAQGAFVAGAIVQTLWLWQRSRAAFAAVQAQDASREAVGFTSRIEGLARRK